MHDKFTKINIALTSVDISLPLVTMIMIRPNDQITNYKRVNIQSTLQIAFHFQN